jgi:hypothetical protein
MRPCRPERAICSSRSARPCTALVATSAFGNWPLPSERYGWLDIFAPVMSSFETRYDSTAVSAADALALKRSWSQTFQLLQVSAR